nr:vegetative cell wall protein gp1-like [Aegilops tauschii subsp. strangulata]
MTCFVTFFPERSYYLRVTNASTICNAHASFVFLLTQLLVTPVTRFLCSHPAVVPSPPSPSPATVFFHSSHADHHYLLRSSPPHPAAHDLAPPPGLPTGYPRRVRCPATRPRKPVAPPRVPSLQPGRAPAAPRGSAPAPLRRRPTLSASTCTALPCAPAMQPSAFTPAHATSYSLAPPPGLPAGSSCWVRHPVTRPWHPVAPSWAP